MSTIDQPYPFHLTLKPEGGPFGDAMINIRASTIAELETYLQDWFILYARWSAPIAPSPEPSPPPKPRTSQPAKPARPEVDEAAQPAQPAKLSHEASAAEVVESGLIRCKNENCTRLGRPLRQRKRDERYVEQLYCGGKDPNEKDGWCRWILDRNPENDEWRYRRQRTKAEVVRDAA